LPRLRDRELANLWLTVFLQRSEEQVGAHLKPRSELLRDVLADLSSATQEI
jgi:hypothetical protein